MTQYKVILPTGLKPLPSQYEMPAAELLVKYFQANVVFVPRSNRKTPDFIIGGVEWELKSPTGSGRHNIRHQLQGGVQQSRCIVFDARRSKIHMTKIRHELAYQFKYAKGVRRMILIEKTKKIVEILR